MDTMKSTSALNKKSKLARTFQKVINLRTATRIVSNNGICMLTSQAKVKEKFFMDKKSQQFDKNDDTRGRQRAVLEALVAKLFAGLTSIKAAYAELQRAQYPYNSEAIQVADQAVVDELKAISELKRSFLRKQLDLSPQVTLMLAEIQEQQGLMKTYEITIKKLETEVDLKDSDITSLQNQLDNFIAFNKCSEKRLNSSGSLSMFDNLRLTRLNVTHFVQFLHHTLRSIRSCVKLMIRDMESAHWDLDAAVKFIEPDAVFTNPNHRFFAFESFVNITMFEGFNFPHFSLSDRSQQQPPIEKHRNRLFFDKFKKLTNVNPRHFLSHNPNSSFAKFTRSKYLHLVHAKMECSLCGNLNQRELVNSGGVPDSAFFVAFAEMTKRVWLLHCLAFSFDKEVTIFQVRKNCRFSEVYMECVAEEAFFYSGEIGGGDGDGGGGGGGELRVGFTVVPGFKIGKTVIQSQVYLSPVIAATATC